MNPTSDGQSTAHLGAEDDALGRTTVGPRRRWRASRAYPDNLTRREVEVLRLLAAGRTNRQIATALGLSVHTVDAHVASLYAKTSARNRAEATAYAYRTGLAATPSTEP